MIKTVARGKQINLVLFGWFYQQPVIGFSNLVAIFSKMHKFGHVSFKMSVEDYEGLLKIAM